jgi:8-oxo-dGTP diphosphatase
MTQVSVELVVMTVQHGALEVLLVRRPGNVWSLPAGPTHGSPLATDAAETLFAQTGISGIRLEQLFSFDRAADTQVAVSYLALIAADRHPLAPGPDIVEVRWFALDDLPALVTGHADAIAYGHARLRAKTAYAPIAVQLLPETFTLGELQAVYEVVLGERLDTRNFRRDVLGAGIVEEAGTARRHGPGRPARLYRSRGSEFAVSARERRIAGRIGRTGGPGTAGE